MRILGMMKAAARVSAGVAAVWLTCAHVAAAQESAPLGANLVHASIADFSARPLLLPTLTPVPELPARAAFADPAPGGGDSYQKWEVEAGAVFTRFRSSIFYASLFGFRSGVGYHVNDWVTLEGGITTGFAPEIYANEHVKYLDYTAGVRIGPRRDRFSPWVHAAIGGAHILPQTAGNTQNSYAFKAGMGVEYIPFYSLSLRGQIDWLRTGFFGQSQNNFQASIGAVVHF